MSAGPPLCQRPPHPCSCPCISRPPGLPLSQPLWLWFSGSPPPGLAARAAVAFPGGGSGGPGGISLGCPFGRWLWCWQRQSWVPQGQPGCRRNMKRGLSPAPSFPASFPSHFLPPPLLFTLPKYAQAVIMGLESSHRHTACPGVPAPSRPQGPPHTAPCCPGLTKARWLPVTQPRPVGTQTAYLPRPHAPPLPCVPSRQKRPSTLLCNGPEPGLGSALSQTHPVG